LFDLGHRGEKADPIFDNLVEPRNYNLMFLGPDLFRIDLDLIQVLAVTNSRIFAK